MPTESRSVQAIQSAAAKLDAALLYREADAVDALLRRVAQYFTNNYDLPMDARVIPYRDMESDFNDQDELRNKHPRYHPSYNDVGGDSDGQTSMEDQLHPGDSTVTGPAVVVDDFSSPSMQGGTGDFTWDKQHQEYDNPAESYKNRMPRR